MISVVIAAWDEGENLKVIVRKLTEVFDEMNHCKRELIFILRGTKEKSGYNYLYKLSKKDKSIKPYYADDIHGYGPSFKLGFEKVSKDSDIVVTLDGDQNHDPYELPSLLKSMHYWDDILIGSRGTERVGTWWKKLLSRLMNTIVRKLTGLKPIDITSGYRIYLTHVIKDIYDKPKSTGFEYLPELLIVAKNMGYTDIVEAPITFKLRTIGESKMPVIKTAIGYLKLIWRYL